MTLAITDDLTSTLHWLMPDDSLSISFFSSASSAWLKQRLNWCGSHFCNGWDLTLVTALSYAASGKSNYLNGFLMLLSCHFLHTLLLQFKLQFCHFIDVQWYHNKLQTWPVSAVTIINAYWPCVAFIIVRLLADINNDEGSPRVELKSYNVGWKSIHHLIVQFTICMTHE